MTTALDRLSYDPCAYSKRRSESLALMDYILDISRHENCGKCRNELGLVGGTAVSHINGNLVDLENDLFNISRPATKCPPYLYQPTWPGEPIVTPKDPIIPGRTANPIIPTQSMHLRACQMFTYPGVPRVPQMAPFSCAP
jgi:hypothetical protein